VTDAKIHSLIGRKNFILLPHCGAFTGRRGTVLCGTIPSVNSAVYVHSKGEAVRHRLCSEISQHNASLQQAWAAGGTLLAASLRRGRYEFGFEMRGLRLQKRISSTTTAATTAR
ncbi:unnamed protein product, partial [Sphacelaria rigidula]